MKRRQLYLGLEPPVDEEGIEKFHLPLIQIVPRSGKAVDDAFAAFEQYTHLLFTSKTAVALFFSRIAPADCKKLLISIGPATGRALEARGLKATMTGREPSAEGIIALLESEPLPEGSHLFWPHSSLSRRLLADFFEKRALRWSECLLYDTIARPPAALPDLNDFDEVFFTSPSTVEAFLRFFTPSPALAYRAIGAVTQKKLDALDLYCRLPNNNGNFDHPQHGEDSHANTRKN